MDASATIQALSTSETHGLHGKDIRYSLTCTRAYEAVMKVRCSRGLVCEDIMGLGIENLNLKEKFLALRSKHASTFEL